MSPPADDDSSDIPTFADIAAEVTGRDDDTEWEDGETIEELEADIEDRSQSGDVDEGEESAWVWMGEVETPDENPVGADFVRQEYEDVLNETQSGDADQTPKLDALEELDDDISNILLLGPGDTAVENDLCASLIKQESGPGRRRVLVTTEQTPDERLATLHGFGAGTFEETTVIAVGERVRSGSGNGNPFEINGETVTIETVRDRRDLTRLGLLINRSLNEEITGLVPTLCFHSFSTLLEGDNLEQLFRFLHVLQSRTSQVGATAHYHLDPSTIADEVVTTIEQLFDLTVRYDDEGNLSLHT